jgi:putative iron-dependent peroxidase
MATKVHSQRVDAPLTRAATFIVLKITNNPSAVATIKDTLSGIDGVAKNVAIRDISGADFACTVGIGSEAWGKLLPKMAKPSELHPFPEVRGQKHTAVSTPGDLLLHIRSDRRDVCFEFERQVMEMLGDSVEVVDETVGFRYFDARDLLGFVDGTANPVGPAVPESVLVTAEDAQAQGSGNEVVGGSYIVVQKYLHDLASWRRLPTEQQEAIIGRTKLDNAELPDAGPGEQCSHKTLATITDDATGEERDILRDNMPFGQPGRGEFGTYFIGYTRRLWVLEKMMERMFRGAPEGKHDRILDFSTPMTGTTFFAPSADVLSGMADDG